MTFTLRVLLINFLLLLGSVTAPVFAHDIGVSESRLVEQQASQYLLSVRSGMGASHLFPTPVLPAHCEFTSNPRGTHIGAFKTFEFLCKNKLTASDTIELAWRRDGVMLNAKWLDGSGSKRLFRSDAGVITVPLSELKAGSGSWIKAAQRYTRLGVEHILSGLDHLLFVLCLLMVVRGVWPLVKTITAFTLAHSITLGLATLGFVKFSPTPVEATIALSIVFLAAEILRHHRGDTLLTLTYRTPWLIAFGFGLLHGFGFAGALANLGLPQSEIPIALLFFNLGVEAGQLMFVAVILLLGFALHKLSSPRQDILLRATAYSIGGLATFWFIQRSTQIIQI